ncbi:MAG: dicarboxylate/amino acid:cation symporter [Bacteroidia bacterium]|nr:dicarboxylate/amino acid:cation symporter [Bacteroidia bacterium]MCO5252826.1 dicarboxylate/amino acid:cation symporter [Bacteroidota bacterium]MCZ2128750.1 dicarboxylate/amino acid:cation symporter [Bacteroidia bacterium]
MKKIALHWKILIGLTAGIIWAFSSIGLGFNSFTQDWVSPFGIIFLNLLKLIAIPLVMFSIITGIAELSDLTKLGRMGTKALIIFGLTTFIAIFIGLGVVNIFGPGKTIPQEQRVKNRITYELWTQNTPDILPVDERKLMQDPKYSEIVNQISKSNIENATNQKLEDKIQVAKYTKKQSPLTFLVDIVPDNIVNSLSNNTLLLQIIFFSVLFGIAIKKIPSEYSERLTFFFGGLNHVYLKMVDIVMWSSPFFVFSLMAGNLTEMAANMQELIEILSVLFKYSLVLVCGLAIMLFIIYPSLYAFFGYQKDESTSFITRYIYFFKSMSPAQLLAFSTSSSAATLPVTIECVNKNLNISKETTSFILPIGAIVNMDGTALYQAVAIVFLAQLHWIDLTIAQQITIVLTTALASIGAASIPGSGLIMLIMVLQSVHLNPAWIAIILPIDRILDMCRTVVNVSGDSVTASIVEKFEQKTNKICRS